MSARPAEQPFGRVGQVVPAPRWVRGKRRSRQQFGKFGGLVWPPLDTLEAAYKIACPEPAEWSALLLKYSTIREISRLQP